MQIIFENDNQPKAQPDPYIIFADDKYYIYATGNADICGIPCYVADKIDGEWTYLGVVYTREGVKEFWAPCVYVEDGKYYMYVSTMPKQSADVHEQRIQVAVSSSPTGPFTFVKELTKPFSIDPHVVKSGEKLFMFYSVNDYEAERAGTYIVVTAMKNPCETEGEPVAVVRPTIDEEIFQRDRFKKGQHWHTLEGAYYFRKDDWHYVIYSGNCYESPYYYLGYASAKSTETDLRKIHFQKQPDEHTYAPLLNANEWESGTGHNSVIEVDGEFFCIYHGRNVGEDKPYECRSARACKLIVDGGKLIAIRKPNEL